MAPDTSPWSGPARALADRILAFVDGSLHGTPPEPFQTLALDVHAWQATLCPVRASLIEGPVHAVQDIPAIPVGLFKDLPVGTVGPEAAGATFRTSGTTGGGRGAHRMRSSALYDHGALAWARVQLGDLPPRSVNLLLDPARHPDSSLSHMVSLFAPEATWHLGPDGVDADAFTHALGDTPTFVGATAFALAELLEDHDPAPLPPGSVLMVTGGFKGRVHRLDDADLYQAAQRVLAPARLVTEYGMTELSSQFWGTPGSRYHPPPWLRAIAVDPHTARVLPPGRTGQLRFVDLCNLDASVAIETLDGGIVHDDGSLTLHGRLEDAPARGCSLTVEEAWAARGRTS